MMSILFVRMGNFCPRRWRKDGRDISLRVTIRIAKAPRQRVVVADPLTQMIVLIFLL